MNFPTQLLLMVKSTDSEGHHIKGAMSRYFCCFLVKTSQIQFPIAPYLWVIHFFEHEKNLASGSKPRSVQSENLKKLANFFKL